MPDVDQQNEADYVRPLDTNRPIYECPKCSKKAMQFYSEAPDDPERTNSFICQACGTTWEM
jgi:DNA-directed RNA polymerase subunit M/transcription elongation factor TFIIS